MKYSELWFSKNDYDSIKWQSWWDAVLKVIKDNSLSKQKFIATAKVDPIRSGVVNKLDPLTWSVVTTPSATESAIPSTQSTTPAKQAIAWVDALIQPQEDTMVKDMLENTRKESQNPVWFVKNAAKVLLWKTPYQEFAKIHNKVLQANNNLDELLKLKENWNLSEADEKTIDDWIDKLNSTILDLTKQKHEMVVEYKKPNISKKVSDLTNI